jgi:diacylglycerol O-acyltransferase
MGQESKICQPKIFTLGIIKTNEGGCTMTSAQHKSEPFSSVDAAWLHMDIPTNLAVITGVMTFARMVDFDRLMTTVDHRLLAFDRFRQRAIEPNSTFGLPRWEEDPYFDLHRHLQRVRLPEPGDHNVLQHYVGDLMSTPLDRNKPLWQIYYVENYLQGCAIVCRLHHCIADGIALMQVLLSLADETPDAPPPEVRAKTELEISPLARLFVPAVLAVRSTKRAMQKTRAVMHQGMDVIVHPERWVDGARLGIGSSKALSKLLFILPDQKTVFKGKCGIPKRAVWSVTIKVDEVKAIGWKMGGTINDILLSAITGALRRYLEERGEPVVGLDIRTIVPVNLRREGDLDQLGNRFGLVFLSLPIGISDPVRRLVLLKRRMNDIKNSPEAMVAIGILGFMGLTPIQVERVITTIFGMKGTAVMTNVPGPQQPLYLAGEAIQSIMFWVPTPANLGLGVSILSYAGDVTLGIVADAEIVPDPEKILQAFQAEFQYLNRWGRPPERKVAAAHPEQVGEVSVQLDDNAGSCQALTKTGKPCKNRALPDSKTCYVHRE